MCVYMCVCVYIYINVLYAMFSLSDNTDVLFNAQYNPSDSTDFTCILLNVPPSVVPILLFVMQNTC